MNKRDIKQAETIAAVLAGAKAMFDELGYEAMTLRLLAARVGVSTGAIYCNFADKAALYEAVFGHPPISPEQGAKLAKLVKATFMGAKMSPEAAFLLGDYVTRISGL
jgi:hypothetical protein